MAFLDSAMGGRIFGTAPLHRAADIGGGEGHGEGADPLQPRRLSLSGRKVLIVEDEFFVGLELAQALETAGAGIVGPAWSLADAKRLAESEEFDMAVVDVNMNGEYAIDLAVELKNRGVRVVFATAYSDDIRLFREDAATIPRLGKPASTRALLRALLPDA
ncbi:response regulator [Parvibaculum sp.]|jgi:DNA-binding NtrC family response regulator|uniref:response regulator n=1 Tax=Parvibaculum sp. TaxID=2024848 RepID=UPI001B2E037B|nr:response regulator [Parvibaculum sp.]MBO6667920.1 response regulator [Parvibaculum sp.]MBO6690533.1 response regulator [Parvibaculum sp.]MBO6714844.1 response regulator [Parvibaculum sp.]|tara:strand:- start:4499 stop:4981 length:483 start_codon:yes stop_codon:yes gene_type:complete